MTPTGATRVAAVIGHPVRHSLSPALHNAAFAAAGLDWTYVAFDVAPGEAARALDAVRALGLGGLSVTMPHKADVAAAVDACTPHAARLRSVNTVAWDDERLVGHSTDGDGFVDSLRVDHGIDPHGWRAVVLGAGGAGRSVVLGLVDAGCAEVVVVARRPDAAAEAAALAGARGRAGTPADVGGADLLVNATPVGMGGAGEELPCDTAGLHAGQVVADLVYHPLDTALLRAARAAGARAVDGLGMLVHQAARQQRIWTGQDPPIAAMRQAALDELARRRT
jgi:shikimate dehydrogenase